MSDQRTVYVLEQGDYEARSVEGVYDTPERAMGDYPGEWRRTTWPPRVDGESERVVWHNRKAGASVTSEKVVHVGPVLSASCAERWVAQPDGFLIRVTEPV